MLRRLAPKIVSIFIGFLSIVGCAAEPAKTTVDGCSGSLSISEVDATEQTIQVGGGAAIGQSITLYDDLLVRRVMFRASSSGLTALILTFYDITNGEFALSTSLPSASFNMTLNFSGALQPLWLTLPTAVQLQSGHTYLIGFAPNSPVNLLWGANTFGTGIRGLYRTGSGSGGPGGGALWGDPVAEKSLSIGLEGDSTCTQR